MNDYIIGFSIAIAACLALIVLVGSSIANISPETADNSVSQYGSLVISAPYMGYVVIGLLAFVAGLGALAGIAFYTRSTCNTSLQTYP